MPFIYVSRRVREFNPQQFQANFSVKHKYVKVRETNEDTPELFEEFIRENIDLTCDEVLFQVLIDLERFRKCPDLWAEKFWKGRAERPTWDLRECDVQKEFREEVLDSISYKGMQLNTETRNLFPSTR